MTKTKLSKTQLEVIRLMKEGWELGKDVSFQGGWWMQKGGLGKGGETKKVGSATAYKLWIMGLIYRPNPNIEFPIEHYALTEEGKQIDA